MIILLFTVRSKLFLAYFCFYVVAFVVWMSMEVSHFMSHFIKQVFMPQTSLNALAESVDILRKQSKQVKKKSFIYAQKN